MAFVPKLEIHVRPMILPKLAGTPDSENKVEVDLWIYLSAGIGEVIFETVVENAHIAEILIEALQHALKNAEVIRE